MTHFLNGNVTLLTTNSQIQQFGNLHSRTTGIILSAAPTMAFWSHMRNLILLIVEWGGKDPIKRQESHNFALILNNIENILYNFLTKFQVNLNFKQKLFLFYLFMLT